MAGHVRPFELRGHALLSAMVQARFPRARFPARRNGRDHVYGPTTLVGRDVPLEELRTGPFEVLRVFVRHAVRAAAGAGVWDAYARLQTDREGDPYPRYRAMAGPAWARAVARHHAAERRPRSRPAGSPLCKRERRLFGSLRANLARQRDTPACARLARARESFSRRRLDANGDQRRLRRGGVRVGPARRLRARRARRTADPGLDGPPEESSMALPAYIS